jgi:hypothetical protein
MLIAFDGQLVMDSFTSSFLTDTFFTFPFRVFSSNENTSGLMEEHRAHPIHSSDFIFTFGIRDFSFERL